MITSEAIQEVIKASRVKAFMYFMLASFCLVAIFKIFDGYAFEALNLKYDDVEDLDHLFSTFHKLNRELSGWDPTNDDYFLLHPKYLRRSEQENFSRHMRKLDQVYSDNASIDNSHEWNIEVSNFQWHKGALDEMSISFDVQMLYMISQNSFSYGAYEPFDYLATLQSSIYNRISVARFMIKEIPLLAKSLDDELKNTSLTSVNEAFVYKIIERNKTELVEWVLLQKPSKDGYYGVDQLLGYELYTQDTKTIRDALRKLAQEIKKRVNTAEERNIERYAAIDEERKRIHQAIIKKLRYEFLDQLTPDQILTIFTRVIFTILLATLAGVFVALLRKEFVLLSKLDTLKMIAGNDSDSPSQIDVLQLLEHLHGSNTSSKNKHE